MTFLGKILIVFQVVLSILFMAFAGSVSYTQQTWKQKFEKSQKDVEAVTADRDKVKTEFNDFQLHNAEDLNKAKSEMQKALAESVGLKTERDQLLKEKRDLNNEKVAAVQQALVAGDEAKARLEEARLLRESNEKLLLSRDQNFKEKTALEDKIRSNDVDLRVAKAKNADMLQQIVSLRKQLQAASSTGSLDSDPTLPPPLKIDGLVLGVQAAKSDGSTDLVSISLGSDEGLQKGHTLIVYRKPDASHPRPKFLGRIRILETRPQTAVGELIKGSRTGVVLKGDYVATQL